MLKRLLYSACCLLCLVCFTACGSPKPAATAEPPLVPQKEQVWQLVAIRGKAVNPNAAVVTIVVNPEAATLSGQAACNPFAAACRLALAEQQPSGDRYTIVLSDLKAGGRQCPEADMNAEARFLALLPKADALVLTAYTLTLLQKDKEILKFELQ